MKNRNNHSEVKERPEWQIHRFVGGVPYPASQQDILKYAQYKGADDGLVDVLSRLPRKNYRNESQVIETVNSMA